MLSSNIDEPPPPYLIAGTEVSAKFKGAFCEAKITRVEKNVRCKITYKHNGQQATVSDEQIRSLSGQMLALNEFRIGVTVQVVKNGTSSSTDELDGSSNTLALLNKVIDQSSYTVIFNDGDEKILRRSFIRFKGEKHYLDSETLNNAPLNNPEHFLYPIKQNNSNDNVLSPSVNSTSRSKSSPTQSLKRANATTNQSDDDESDEENKSETNKKSKKPAAKRRTISVDETEEQQQSDQNKNSDVDTSDTDSDSSSSSDDFPSEVKDRFVATLYKFMDDRGTPMNRLPTINCVDIDLHRFFIVVRRYGGYNKVCKLRNWADVYKRLNLPNINHSSNIINLKCAYKRYLQPFEDFYRKLGSTMLDLVSRNVTYNTSSAKRNISDSHRSLQLFKNRVYTPNSATQKRGLSKYKQQKQAVAAATTSATTTLITTKTTNNDLNTSSLVDTTINEIKSEPIERKSSVDSTVESLELVKQEEIQFKQSVNEDSTVIKSPETTSSDQPQASTEELTLFSMVRNLNENYKKARLKEKESNKKYDDDSTDKEIKVENVSSPASTAHLTETSNKKTSKLKLLTSEQKTKKKPSSSSISSSSSTTSSSSSTKANENNNDEYDEDSLDDLSKPKRKPNRLSASGSDENQIVLETKKKLGMKRKNSSSNNLVCISASASMKTNATSSSNTETNDESENDKDCDSVTDTDFKSVLSIGDLEVNQIVDVKYINGSQKRDYPAKIMQINTENHTVYVHYLGWNTRYDEWVKLDRIKRTIDDSSNPQKRRKSMKTKQSTQGSPSSSSSSHLNESSPNQNKTSSSNTLTAKKTTTEVIALKINERSSSTSTTSSLSADPIKEELTESQQVVKDDQSVKNNSDNELKTQPTINCENSITIIENIKTIEETIESTVNNDLITNGDSLLSIKEEIIESEQIDYTNITPTASTTATNSSKIEEVVVPTLLPPLLPPPPPPLIPMPQTDDKTKINHKNENRLNNQENLKSQSKSPKESIRQIILQQPSSSSTSSSSSDNSDLKILINNTNQLNEIITDTNEDDLKKKPILHEESKEQKKPECIDNCKYSLNLNDSNLFGKQRIRYIEEQMKVCREVYAKLKNEIAAIDRKKKKQKRNTTSFESNTSMIISTTNINTTTPNSTTNKSIFSNCGLSSTTSSNTNEDTLMTTPKALKS